MQGYSILNPLFLSLLNTGLVQKIYHSVIIHEQGDNRYPAYRVGDEWHYTGVDDTKIMGCYLRQTGDLQNARTEHVTSCEKFYITRVPYRLVFFNDHETRNHDDLQVKIMNIVFEKDIEFVRFINDKTRLANEETALKGFNFGGNTFYAALDFFVLIRLTRNNCGTEISCGEIENPICKS